MNPYGVLRIIITGLTFLAVGITLCKSGFWVKRWIRFTLFFVVIGVFVGLSFWPFENLFVTFPTPEKAYKYNHLSDVSAVVHGEESSLVISLEDVRYSYAVIPKSDRGWKLGINSSWELVSENLFDNFKCIHVKGTSDYYVIVYSSINSSVVDVEDSYGSTFASIADGYTYIAENQEEIYVELMLYFTCIVNPSAPYFLILDGEPILIPVGVGKS